VRHVSHLPRAIPQVWDVQLVPLVIRASARCRGWGGGGKGGEGERHGGPESLATKTEMGGFGGEMAGHGAISPRLTLVAYSYQPRHARVVRC
jgi:hypothetical protein